MKWSCCSLSTAPAPGHAKRPQRLSCYGPGALGIGHVGMTLNGSTNENVRNDQDEQGQPQDSACLPCTNTLFDDYYKEYDAVFSRFELLTRTDPNRAHGSN